MKINWSAVGRAVETAVVRCLVAAAVGVVYFVQASYTHWKFEGAQYVILVLGYFLPDADKWLFAEAEDLDVPVPPPATSSQ